MIKPVDTGVSLPDAALPQRSEEPRRQAPKPAQAAAPAPEAPDSDLRLVIERGSDNAYYVYRLIDRTTGKVVVELPRDRVADLANEPSYSAGDVVTTKA
jgi:flagellar protein FlaG